MASRIFTWPTCGPPQACGFHSSYFFKVTRPRKHVLFIVGMHAETHFTGTWAMASLKMLARRWASIWAVGPGVPTHGTLIRTAIPTSILQTVTFQALTLAIWAASSGGRSSGNLLQPPFRRQITSADGTLSTN